MKNSPSKEENKPPNKQILVPILLTSLLLLVILGGIASLHLFFPNRTFPGSPNSSSTALSAVNQSDLVLNTTYPTFMPIQTSVVVEVVLVTVYSNNISTIPVENARVVSSPSEPQGTPTASLAQAFGQDYTPTLTASLTSNAFKITSIPSNVNPQTLDQPTVKWKWSIFSLNTNDQVLDVTVFSTWHSKKNASDVIGPYIIAEQELLIHVLPLASSPIPTPTPLPFIEPGHIDIGNLITEVIVALLGAGGLVTIFIVWLINRSKNRNKTHSTSTKSQGVDNKDKTNQT